jgi:sugar-specific transcriptional regulator TrmB
MEQEIIKLLTKFGISELEAIIYIGLLKIGPCSPLELSKHLKRARTSVYDNLDKLLEAGLVEKIILENTQNFKAHSLESLQTIIDNQKSKISEMDIALSKLSKLDTLTKKPSQNVEVKYYEGLEGMRQMIWNTLSAEKFVTGYSILGRNEIVGKKFINRYLKEFKNRGIIDKVIINPKKHSYDAINRKIKIQKDDFKIINDVRVIPTSIINIKGDISIYNDIYALQYWDSQKIYGVEIQSKELVYTQKTIFETFWKMAEPFKIPY